MGDFMTLEGQVAIVTGAAQGIGLAIARRLARAGAAVAVVDRDRDLADRTTATLRLSALLPMPFDSRLLE